MRRESPLPLYFSRFDALATRAQNRLKDQCDNHTGRGEENGSPDDDIAEEVARCLNDQGGY